VNSNPVGKLQLSYELASEVVNARRGTYVTDDDYDRNLLVGDKNVDVFTPSGLWLLSYRVGVYDPKCYQHLVSRVASMKGNVDGRRGSAVHREAILPLLCKDGTVSGSRVHHVPHLKSLGDAAAFRFGYSGPTGLNPYAHQTGDSEAYPAAFKEMNDLIRDLDNAFELISPELRRRQSDALQGSPWLIPNTCFSSVTVNRNWQTSLHPDEDNFGPAVATVLTQGGPRGADLVFPQYFLPVSLRPGNVMIADTHVLHGNTALYGVPGKTYRISFFAYLHNSILRCGSVEEEAKRRERWVRARNRA